MIYEDRFEKNRMVKLCLCSFLLFKRRNYAFAQMSINPLLRQSHNIVSQSLLTYSYYSLGSKQIEYKDPPWTQNKMKVKFLDAGSTTTKVTMYAQQMGVRAGDNWKKKKKQKNSRVLFDFVLLNRIFSIHNLSIFTLHISCTRCHIAYIKISKVVQISLAKRANLVSHAKTVRCKDSNKTPPRQY